MKQPLRLEPQEEGAAHRIIRQRHRQPGEAGDRLHCYVEQDENKAALSPGGKARGGKFLLQWPNNQRGAEKTPGQPWSCSEEPPADWRNPWRQRELHRTLRNNVKVKSSRLQASFHSQSCL
ncbi:unnamed protein product [Pleuronectes platessa]|uniref:Uncharacterized protein n=1 Tax=Pleuronectes platessa TaxID=8262 RepID=A0A9N7TI51_PLEPL|nr:unnamed protein product [Pleuronectes platessa]